MGAATTIPAIPDSVPKPLLKKSTIKNLLYDGAGMIRGKDYEFTPTGILLVGDGFAKLNNTINDQFAYARSFQSYADMYRELGETAKAQNAAKLAQKEEQRGKQLQTYLAQATQQQAPGGLGFAPLALAPVAVSAGLWILAVYGLVRILEPRDAQLTRMQEDAEATMRKFPKSSREYQRAKRSWDNHHEEREKLALNPGGDSWTCQALTFVGLEDWCSGASLLWWAAGIYGVYTVWDRKIKPWVEKQQTAGLKSTEAKLAYQKAKKDRLTSFLDLSPGKQARKQLETSGRIDPKDRRSPQSLLRKERAAFDCLVKLSADNLAPQEGDYGAFRSWFGKTPKGAAFSGTASGNWKAAWDKCVEKYNVKKSKANKLPKADNIIPLRRIMNGINQKLLDADIGFQYEGTGYHLFEAHKDEVFV